MAEAQPDPFAALGDPMRRRIVEILAEGSRSVGQIAADLPISRPAVSRHLRVLREAGLVDDEPDGTMRRYHLEERGAAQVRVYLEQIWGEAVARFRMAAENTTPRGADDSSDPTA